MLFNATIDDLKAVKAHLRTLLPAVKSGHLDEAISSGLGYAKYASLLTALKSSSAVLRVSTGDFEARVIEFGHPKPNEKFLQALLYATPGALVGENYDESMVQAVAWEIERLRDEELDDDGLDAYGDAPRAFSLNLEYMDEGRFDARGTLSRDLDMTIWVSESPQEVADLLACNPGDLRELVRTFEEYEWIADYVPEDLDLSGPPTVSTRCMPNGIHAAVWPAAVVYRVLEKPGHLARYVRPIDEKTYERVVDAMMSYHEDDANRVFAALGIVPLHERDILDEDFENSEEADRPSPLRSY